MKNTRIAKTRRAVTVFDRLIAHYPPVTTFLTHGSPFQLLIAVIMSAQCTDARVNMVTPGLFAQFPDVRSMADADPEEVAFLIKSINFFSTKARNIVATAQRIRDVYHGVVPETLVDMVTLPGVGRKTANVMLGQAFGQPGITVDTHVNRLSRRLGFTTNTDAEKIERDLQKVWPEAIWTDLSSYLIVHGREVCGARYAKCDVCVLSDLCPSAFGGVGGEVPEKTTTFAQRS
jgi:endonuclease-3